MSSLSAHFHCQGPSEHQRGTAVTTEELGDCATVRLGIGGEMPSLTIFITRPAEAFAIAQAFATAGEILEARAALSRRGEVPAEAWQDVPLPLDVTDDSATGELCACGKSAAHVLAPADTAEWSCRVPSVYPALEAVARDMDAPDCIHGTREQCHKVGCADERCPAF